MTQKCIKCKKLGRLFTCHGCQQIFCDEHIDEHRQELAYKLREINQEYHNFEENHFIQPCLNEINQWEHKSIKLIQKTAEIARDDLLKLSKQIQNRLKISLEKIHSDIQTYQQSKEYTEINLNRWTEQLEQLRQTYRISLNDTLVYDQQSSIRLIKIIDKNQSFTTGESHEISQEKFSKTVGHIILSDDKLTATCIKRKWNGSNISGKNIYSSGIHSVRFRILKKGKNDFFFGITSTIKETNPWNRKTPFAYGWWEIPLTGEEIKIIAKEDEKRAEEKKPPINRSILPGDEVTLTLDCISNQIQLEHHRTNRFIDKIITNEQCPLPWKIAVVLYSPGDSVSIVSK